VLVSTEQCRSLVYTIGLDYFCSVETIAVRTEVCGSSVQCGYL